LLVQQLFDALVVPALLQQVQQHAGIQRAAARTHHQAVQRGKAHGGGHAHPALRGAQAGAVAQVGHDHAAAPAHGLRVQHRHDVLVGQAMEAVAAHALLAQRTRQREGVVHLGHVGVEGGVETGHLRQLGESSAELADARQVVRLVQRRERIEARQLFQHLVGHVHAVGVFAAAMHDAVRHGLDALRRSQLLHQPPQAL